ncbi:hypothetical protein OSH11_19595 [Kaistia dalseonensis]|uniref:Uncharacterized protein n=1 Tax=Kaistia dalseonensis TaxID=410840 RepID=A0ABU0HCF4_9HYPH|nr:hypothetical protein [Kaistia dalseonensis]MCX5496918.1 hypothetical protein [Kaistia dalseonensis]MDQ0439543.1 hypothetical protein [Kaistia dalseonensis]
MLTERLDSLGRWLCWNAAALLFVIVGALPAFGQNAPTPPADIPDGAAPSDPLSLAPLLPDHVVDPAALLKPGVSEHPAGAAKAKPQNGFTLEAKLTDAGALLPTGVVWRIFADAPGSDGKLPLVNEINGGTVHVPLKPGNYLVHAAYGRAGVSKRIVVNGDGQSDTLVLNAGGLKLSAIVGKDQMLPAKEVEFDIYPGGEQNNSEQNAIATDVNADTMVRLNAGTYHVVCRYGDANAVVRADIKVEAGKLTEASLFQKAARITLKLVSEDGGEALANTSWSVMTPGGDSVFDSVGAFPDVVLAIGEYTAVAKHDNKIHERNFTVESGRNREVEVLAN